MEIKFIERVELVRNEKKELVEAVVLKLCKSWGDGATRSSSEVRAFEEDIAAHKAEYDAFLKAKELVGFDEFVKSKMPELEKQFLASKVEKKGLFVKKEK